RLVDFFFEGAERGPPGRTRGISIKRVALYARPSGLISMKRGLVRAAISSANALRSITALAFRLCLCCRGAHPALGLVLVANVVECAPEGQLARKRVISALIQQANLLAVEPLFFDLEISAPEKLRRKLLHSEAYGFRGNLESLVFNAPRSVLVAPGRIKFRERRVIKCHCKNPPHRHPELLWTLRDPQIANGRPGSSSACTPRIACFSQRGFKLLDRVIWQLRTGADTRNLVRSTGLLGDPIAKLGV